MPRTALAFGPGARAFFRDLEAHNTKEFWTANRDRFEREIAAPMGAMVEALTPEFGAFKTFRMNRDVRFSADKSPYKTQHGSVAYTSGGSVYYFHLSKDGVFAAAGMHVMERDQLARFREALQDDDAGPAFVAAVTAVEQAGLMVEPGREQPLKTAPRGVDPEHPRIPWLRWKAGIATKHLGNAAGSGVDEAVAAVWRSAAPLVEWLDAHVGPSR